MPLQAQESGETVPPISNQYAAQLGKLPPFDYDFGGYTWSGSGNANIAATPYSLSSGSNKYDNYLFETRPVGQNKYINRFIFRYEYKKQALNADGAGNVDTLQINDVLFIYRSFGQPVYVDVGWGMRSLSYSSNNVMYPNWYLATGVQLAPKLGLHYQLLSAVNTANNSTEQTLYLDYLVGHKSYLMLGYKQQDLYWAGGSSLHMDGYLLGVYFRF